jgi:hypothetical protein
MRAKEFLIEKAQSAVQAQPAVTNLKTQIIGQVKKTNDADLLQKIYTVLNKTGLVDRIGLVLDRDTDTKGYVKQLVDMIIEVPGTYEEKAAFVKQYPTGYIDIEKMLNGKYIKFTELIKGEPGAPIDFVHRVFDSLKQVTFGGAKGPGEFGLAVLSPFIKITGKGNKQRFVPISPLTQKYIELYRNTVRNQLSIQKGFEDTLFLNRRGKQLTRAMIFTIIKDLAVKINLNKNISPHTFRHSFASHLLENGADLRSIQLMLGHESITTTEIYVHLDRKHLTQVLHKFHPRK